MSNNVKGRNETMKKEGDRDHNERMKEKTRTQADDRQGRQTARDNT